MNSRLRAVITSAGVFCVCSAGDCFGIADPANYNFDTSQAEQVWAFVAIDNQGREQQARVILKGCTQSQCTGATLESVPPDEWGTAFGNCTLRWHLSGQVSGDLVSFTINGNNCETSIQGRSVGGGRLNGRFGTATSTVDVNSTMSWNGITTLFGGQSQSFSGSARWRAFRVQ